LNVHQEWTDQLSDYLDGELPEDERSAVDEHLRRCASCAAVLNDLKRVVARAASAEARPPQADLWRGIAARLNEGGEPGRVVPFAPTVPRRFIFTLPQLAAAAALLIAVSGGVAWQLAARTGRPEGLHYTGGDGGQARDARSADLQVRPDSAAAPGVGVEGTGAADFARIENVGMADAQYDAAVADLEKALKAGRGSLDASTVAIVEHNLQIIDQAINQAREALEGDPANSYLSGHLVEARRRKLDLLRRATALASETN
jgi:tetratricopeptide (TPR) repeat protein